MSPSQSARTGGGVTSGKHVPSTVTPALDPAIPDSPATPPDEPDSLRAKTLIAYRRRAAQLMRRCLKERGTASKASGVTGAATAVTDLVFVDWLVGRKAGWVPTSWRQNKAAVCGTLTSLIESRAARLVSETDPAVIARLTTRIAQTQRALDRLRAEGSEGCATETDKTSSTKTKRLPEAERVAIAAAAAAMASRYAGDLGNCLLAGVRTGLRPSEWAGTRALAREDGALVLIVPNAKVDEVRGHGPTRTLVLTALPVAERVTVLRWLARARTAEAGAAYPALLTALGDLLYTLTRRLWPRRRLHPTLYSARHQAAALMKLIHDPAEVAALMGHATDETSRRHYGRYRSGKGLPPEIRELTARLPQPVPEEVARIRARLDASLARLPALRARTTGPSMTR